MKLNLISLIFQSFFIGVHQKFTIFEADIIVFKTIDKVINHVNNLLRVCVSIILKKTELYMDKFQFPPVFFQPING